MFALVRIRRDSSSEQPDKFNQLLGIVRKQSKQIKTLRKIVNTKQQSTNYNSRYNWFEPQRRALLCFGCNEPGHKIADRPVVNSKKSGNG